MNEEEMKTFTLLNDESSVDDLGIVVCEESDLVFSRQKKKVVKPYFDGGTYLTNYPNYRDGWTKTDWDFYSALVRLKVGRANKKSKVPVLDDLIEFRMLPTNEANTLCQWLFDNEFVFVVYEGDEIRKKENEQSN
jgi:hypothetical protein